MMTSSQSKHLDLSVRVAHLPNPSGYFVSALKGDWGSLSLILEESGDRHFFSSLCPLVTFFGCVCPIQSWIS